MGAPQALLELIERFERNHDAYRSGRYNEAQARIEFIDPMFKLLGWDMNNEAGYAEAYKNVIHEDSLPVSGATKAPDYCFRVGGTRKFFLEAKKPSVNLKDDISPAFQLRRYAWSAKLPLSILTDFEEFAVYDCRAKPDKSDKASTARTLYVTSRDYAQRWDEIQALFSREAILKGAFDKYAESAGAKRGTAEVDDVFLQDIESWRDALAHNIALRNPSLSQRDLNHAVQATIDRIIFLRICEARGIEDYGRLMALQNGGQVFARLCNLFQSADERYNSGLFHFRVEKGRDEPADAMSLRLTIDDKTLKDIIKSLYYPDSPYEFSVLPADILGQVYEQFLGKVIRLTAGHRAEVEDKPEVKKAGGVYYTPTYIVDYIVTHTLGALLDGKSPRQVSGLRILDPACGSGSFLIGAYQRLLDWHRDWYIANDPKKWAVGRSPLLYQASGGDWRLTTGERKRILLNNIYGVDIDPQAVEVTKLSLLLKVLEGENEQTLATQLRLFQERALPDLSKNIKCGNSLIGPDFYDNRQMGLLDDEERYRINVFDWKAEFPEVFAPSPSRGGGRVRGDDTRRPPSSQPSPSEGEGAALAASSPQAPKSGGAALHSPVSALPSPEVGRGGGGEGGFDVVIGNPPYVLLQSLNQPPVFAYLSGKYGAATYKVDTYQVFMEKAIDLTAKGGFVGFITPNSYLRNKFARALRQHILKKANVEKLIAFYYPVFSRASVDTCVLILARAERPDTSHAIEVIRSYAPNDLAASQSISQDIWLSHPENHFSLPNGSGSESLTSKVENISQPLGSFATAYFGIQTFDRTQYVRKSQYSQQFRPVIDGGNIGRYELKPGTEFVEFRPEAIKSGGKQDVYEQERIGVRQIGASPIATILPAGIYTLNTIYNIYANTPTEYSYRFVLGVLASKLMVWYWNQCFYDQKETFPKIKKAALLGIPIRTINFTDLTDKARHDQMVEMVERMLALHRQLAAANTAFDKTAIQRQIDATDKQIDRLVYELYGLTAEEIGVVEGGEE